MFKVIIIIIIIIVIIIITIIIFVIVVIETITYSWFILQESVVGTLTALPRPAPLRPAPVQHNTASLDTATHNEHPPSR